MQLRGELDCEARLSAICEVASAVPEERKHALEEGADTDSRGGGATTRGEGHNYQAQDIQQPRPLRRLRQKTPATAVSWQPAATVGNAVCCTPPHAQRAVAGSFAPATIPKLKRVRRARPHHRAPQMLLRACPVALTGQLLELGPSAQMFRRCLHHIVPFFVSY